MSQHAITRRSALALMGLCAASCLVPARIAGADTQQQLDACLLYTSPSPRDRTRSRMPSSA